MERFLASVLSSVNFLGRDPTDVSLDQYVELLKEAPGSTTAEKVEYLSGIDITLSAEGMRQLQGRCRFEPLLGCTPGAGNKH
jgi:hypothetical protein